MQLYAITGPITSQSLLCAVREWAAGGVDFIQLRQKELDPQELKRLAAEIAGAIAGARSRLLINIPKPAFAEWAFAAGAAGVHLPGKPAPGAVDQVRLLFPGALVTVPCHSIEEVAIAVEEQVDAVLFSPVFEKVAATSVPQGLESLGRACVVANGIPVFALGGVTAANAGQCIMAGAAGIAGIRLFAGNDWQSLAAS